jgi:hypothetical protein
VSRVETVGIQGLRLTGDDRQLGFELKGESANTYWGVLDTQPITNCRSIQSYTCDAHSSVS